MHWRLFFKVLALSTFISAAVASLFLYPIKEAGHVAAWVQAVGSIGAIVGAIYTVQKPILEGRADAAKRLVLYDSKLFEMEAAIDEFGFHISNVSNDYGEVTGISRSEESVLAAQKAVLESLDKILLNESKIGLELFVVRDPRTLNFVRDFKRSLNYFESQKGSLQECLHKGDLFHFQPYHGEVAKKMKDSYGELIRWIPIV